MIFKSIEIDNLAKIVNKKLDIIYRKYGENVLSNNQALNIIPHRIACLLNRLDELEDYIDINIDKVYWACIYYIMPRYLLRQLQRKIVEKATTDSSKEIKVQPCPCDSSLRLELLSDYDYLDLRIDYQHFRIFNPATNNRISADGYFLTNFLNWWRDGHNVSKFSFELQGFQGSSRGERQTMIRLLPVTKLWDVVEKLL